jgi:TolA-binding protein
MADVKSPNNGPDASESNSPAPNDIPINGSGTGTGPATGQNKRKRVSSNSARGVANLTPQQLERKRANDREAQRAIRERTKQQIDRLNEKIRELESAQPYRDLQAVISQKEAVEAENIEIKRQLAHFINVFRAFAPGPQRLEGICYM